MKREHSIAWKATSDTGCCLRKQVRPSLSVFKIAWLVRTRFYILSACVVEISVFTEMKVLYIERSTVFVYTENFPISTAAV